MASAFSQRFQALAQGVDRMSLRERVLVFAALLALVLFAAGQLLVAPLNAERGRLVQRLQATRTQISTVEAQTAAVAQSLRADPDAAERSRVAALRQQLTDLEQRLQTLTAGVVAPRVMLDLVHDVVARSDGVRVLGVTSLAPQVLAAEAGDTQGPMLYRHAMRLELEGAYLDVLRYLRRLEALPWKVFWGELSLSADDGAPARVVVVVYTLSREAAWIGT